MTEEKPIVYITQLPNRRDQNTGMMVPVVDISPASEHGEIKIIMPAGASFFATADMVTQLRAGLRDYDFDRGDAIIALGDPAIIAVVGALLGERNRSFTILRWDGYINRYVRVVVKL